MKNIFKQFGKWLFKEDYISEQHREIMNYALKESGLIKTKAMSKIDIKIKNHKGTWEFVGENEVHYVCPELAWKINKLFKQSEILQKLKEELIKMVEYADHKKNCMRDLQTGWKCSCGLDELLKQCNE